MESKRVICPVCGDDLGPAQPFMSTLTGCRRCRVWVNNAGEIVKERSMTGLLKSGHLCRNN